MEGTLTFLLILVFGVVILMFISRWKIYEKAGKPGWAIFIPIYNILVLLEIIKKPGWWILMYLIPFVNIVYLIWTINLLSKAFGKSEGFTVGLIFLPYIFYPILAFDKSIQYVYGNNGNDIDEIGTVDPAV